MNWEYQLEVVFPDGDPTGAILVVAGVVGIIYFCRLAVKRGL